MKNEKKTVLKPGEAECLKKARSILRRLTKKAKAWDARLQAAAVNDMTAPEYAKWHEKALRFDDWADALYDEAKVDMAACECFLDTAD